MRNERVLLILVLADFALVIGTIAAEAALSFMLPAPLLEEVIRPNLADLVRLPWFIAIVLATVVSWIGLLNYWVPARILYLGAWAAWLVLVATAGPSVMTGPGAAIETLEHLVGGAIIGVVYFSDLRRRFDDDSEPEPVSAG